MMAAGKWVFLGGKGGAEQSAGREGDNIVANPERRSWSLRPTRLCCRPDDSKDAPDLSRDVQT